MAHSSTASCPRPNFARSASSKLLSRRYRQQNSENKSILEQARYNAYTVWLFTRSDLKTIVFPSTVFALVNGIASVHLGLSTDTTTLQLLARAPLILLYTWINLLPFAIDNQRQQSSIEEDELNKPWRSLPSKRLDQDQATKLMFVCYFIALVLSTALGAPLQCIALMGFGFAYNDLNGADISPIIRNLINGFGYMCFTSGALQVAMKGEAGPILVLAWWFSFIFMIVCTTVQSQDMYDQEGDAMRNRRTVPLVVGDGVARYTIILPVAGWSVVCPWMWDCSIAGYLTVVGLGLVVMRRTWTKRTVSADKQTFRLWNLWLTSVYCLPLVKSLGLA